MNPRQRREPFILRLGNVIIPDATHIRRVARNNPAAAVVRACILIRGTIVAQQRLVLRD